MERGLIMKPRPVLLAILLVGIIAFNSIPTPLLEQASGEESGLHRHTLPLREGQRYPADVRGEGSMVPYPSVTPSAVAVVVESSIYANVSSAVAQYMLDLNNTGYHTLLYTAPISSAEELKGNLSVWYTEDSLIGAVLIGRLPYAQFYHPTNGGFNAETFICDLFLMDLDGTWSDLNPVDGIYDSHTAGGSGDIFPEIFVSRIDPTCLSWGGTVADHINTYLARVHTYRTGGVQRSHRALVYIDDDWTPWGHLWSSRIGYAYQVRTTVLSPTWTNATDWRLNRLTQDYQWGHLCAHSSPTTHYFGPSGSGEGTVSSTQIRAVPPAFNFYNLFCCSGARWTSTDNLGVTYLFSGPNSLAVIGSTKTGSMMDYDDFYGPIGQNQTLGDSLREWFQHSLRTDSEAGSIYLEWYYGMNILGDPLLQVYYDCTVLAPDVFSPTHPNSSLWYANDTPVVNWTAPPDVNGISGYYYILDHDPLTVPTASSGVYTTNTSVTMDGGLPSGEWYFHVVAVDGVGNVGNDTAHFKIQIDTAGPAVTVQSPSLRQNLTTASCQIAWSVNDALSGYAYSTVSIDETQVYNGTSLTCLAVSLTEGVHLVNITAFDNVGNNGSCSQEFLVDLTDPVVETFTYTQIGLCVDISWSVVDSGSGYKYADLFLNGEFMLATNVSQSAVSVEDLDLGEYTLKIVVYDWAGRNASSEIALTVVNSEYLWGTVPLAVGVFMAVIVVYALVVTRRGRQ
ncbi:MAG: hypothetical protein ACP6KW_03885 [Candidatus Thorarchaeota archaeon]